MKHLEEENPFEEDQTEVKLRYGIINLPDLIRDLEHWETLMVSSMMQRPIHTLIDDPELHIWDNYQQKNLKSALAYAALTTPSGYEERDLYENIVGIPHYESHYLQLLDREDET